MDLAPIQPTYVPLNCSFYVGDIILDLDDDVMFPPGSIDLVHMRCESFSIISLTILDRYMQARKQRNGQMSLKTYIEC